MDQPMIVVNFKTYASASGESAESLLAAMEAHANGPATLVAVASAFDWPPLPGKPPTWRSGRNTSTRLDWADSPDGWNRNRRSTVAPRAPSSITPSTRLSWTTCVPCSRCSRMVFPFARAADVEEAKALAALNPTYIAVEPPELIGGDISVTTADPAIVSDTVAAVKAVNPKVRALCGAGVKNGRDVAKALELGAEGVLLASGVTKANDVHAVLADLVASL